MKFSRTHFNVYEVRLALRLFLNWTDTCLRSSPALLDLKSPGLRVSVSPDRVLILLSTSTYLH